MASWASVAKAAQGPAAPAALAPTLDTSQKEMRVVVVDANAIINGVRLEGVADKAVTIQEVLEEIRDKQSRQFLATLPFGIEVKEPPEESMAAGAARGRAIGLGAAHCRVVAACGCMQ